MTSIGRRAWLAAAAGAPLGLLGACAPRSVPMPPSRWVGAAVERGHRLRETAPAAAIPVQRRAGVVIVGAGISGLAAARALVQAGIDDVHLLDLEDTPGGNSRAHRLGGIDCPLGAHYLPVPDEHAVEVAELLDDLGLRRVEHGRAVYDERHLCHSPQERLHIGGDWHEGLLPPVEALPAAQRAATAAQYRRFAATIADLGREAPFRIPTARAPWTASHAELDATTFAAWLDALGFDAPALRWYLDYCCRDDYGAAATQVSAWAGVHYFASRHGFHAPGDESPDRDAVLTWPQGNAWLTQRLAEPLHERIHTGGVVTRIVPGRHDVAVDLWNDAARRRERWTAMQIVLAVPLFVARRLLDPAPPALPEAAARLRHAPWLVANLQLATPLADRPGVAPSWDNVVFGSPALGYVDAMHQSLRPHPGPTVLTFYWALGGAGDAELAEQRRRLLAEPASTWAAAVVADLQQVHRDLPERIVQIDLMRYGHAMAIPRPGVRGSPALQALAAPSSVSPRVHFAHADLSGYSVFEEAMFQGVRAAERLRAVFSRASALRSRVPPPGRRG
jgi:protoporphyrinogen oxidase